jgi:hypothetical protein
MPLASSRAALRVAERLFAKNEDADLFTRTDLSANRRDDGRKRIAIMKFMQLAQTAAMSGALFSGIIAVLLIFRGG